MTANELEPNQTPSWDSSDDAIRKESEEIDESEDTTSGTTIKQPFDPSKIDIANPPMNLGDLIDLIQYGWIDFEPDYQREGNLWPAGKQSRLIESALLGLRLPAFYFEEVSKKKWRIIDGLQRCSALRNFCVDRTMCLSELEFLDFNGMGYEDFDFELRRDLRMLPITVNLLKPGVPDPVKYILFKRLNTGGETLTPQEIRNSMFQGRAIDLVKRLASSPDFKLATGNKIPTRRKQHHDFVSRFIAFYLKGYETYCPDIDRFVNDAMGAINKGVYSQAQLDDMYDAFAAAMRMSYTIFGQNAFRKTVFGKRGPINKALFEVVSVTFARLSQSERIYLTESCSNEIANALTELMFYDERFYYALSTATGREDNVTKRFSEFSKMIAKILGKKDDKDS